MILPIDDKELFLRYAIPCGRVLVERGSLDQRILDRLHSNVMYEKTIRDPVGKCFPVAAKMTGIIASRMGKDAVDEDVIRRYFLFEHRNAVEWRARIFPDVNPNECIVYPGRVLSAGEDMLVHTPLGERLVRNDFVSDIKRNDWVTVHYDFAGEKISKETADRMLKELGMI